VPAIAQVYFCGGWQTSELLSHKMDKSDLLNKQAIVMLWYQRYLNPVVSTFIPSFVLPSVLSLVILASWVSSHFSFLYYPCPYPHF